MKDNPSESWSRQSDLNGRPADYESAVLDGRWTSHNKGCRVSRRRRYGTTKRQQQRSRRRGSVDSRRQVIVRGSGNPLTSRRLSVNVRRMSESLRTWLSASDRTLRDVSTVLDVSKTRASEIRSTGRMPLWLFARACFRLELTPDAVVASLVEAFPDEASAKATG